VAERSLEDWARRSKAKPRTRSAKPVARRRGARANRRPKHALTGVLSAGVQALSPFAVIHTHRRRGIASDLVQRGAAILGDRCLFSDTSAMFVISMFVI
jgi:hypothetical protein